MGVQRSVLQQLCAFWTSPAAQLHNTTETFDKMGRALGWDDSEDTVRSHPGVRPIISATCRIVLKSAMLSDLCVCVCALCMWVLPTGLSPPSFSFEPTLDKVSQVKHEIILDLKFKLSATDGSFHSRAERRAHSASCSRPQSAIRKRKQKQIEREILESSKAMFLCLQPSGCFPCLFVEITKMRKCG